MKIGIITFHAAHNYGSMLQAYAMQTFLERQGHHVEIVNFRPLSQKRGYSKPIDFTTKANIKKSIKRILLAPQTIAPLNKKWQLFDKFLHQYLNLTKNYSTLDELKAANFDYDILITGSDQIWNTKAFDFSEAYFGTFVDNKTKKVAYAPSMGPEPEKQDVTYLRKLFQGYSAVSVREERTKDFLVSNHIYDNVTVVLDPTMLLEGSDYDLLYGKKPLVNEDYIFYYTPGGVRHEFLSEASKIGKQMSLPVICDSCYSPGDLDRYDNVTPYIPVGPAEFLNLIKNAKFVCGASFHLMVFAILFQKNFCCMNGDVDSRMNNLMKECGCEDRIWKPNLSDINRYHVLKIDKENSIIEDSFNFIDRFVTGSSGKNNGKICL